MTTVKLLGLSLLLLGLQPVQAYGANKAQDISFHVLAQLNERESMPKSEMLIRTPDQLAIFWHRYVSNQKMPEIDFSQDMIMVVADSQPTSGYTHCVRRMYLENNQLHVLRYTTEPDESLFLPLQKSFPGCVLELPQQRATDVVYQLETTIQERKVLNMRELIHVSNSMIQEPREVISRDLDSFKLIWKEHGATISSLPDIDFKQDMVIAVFMGEQSTGGYDLKIKEVVETDKELQVYLERRNPPVDSMVIQMLTAPAHFVAVPISEKPIVFVQNN